MLACIKIQKHTCTFECGSQSGGFESISVPGLTEEISFKREWQWSVCVCMCVMRVLLFRCAPVGVTGCVCVCVWLQPPTLTSQMMLVFMPDSFNSALLSVLYFAWSFQQSVLKVWWYFHKRDVIEEFFFFFISLPAAGQKHSKEDY